MTTHVTAYLAVRQYVKRRAANAELVQVDNASLYAGSPMHYYCRFCRQPTEILPESHTCRAKTVCDSCEVIRDLGLIDAKGEVV